MSSLLVRPQLLDWPLSSVRCAALPVYGPQARFAQDAPRALPASRFEQVEAQPLNGACSRTKPRFAATFSSAVST